MHGRQEEAQWGLPGLVTLRGPFVEQAGMKDRRRRGIREGTAGEVRGGPGGEARSIPERIRDRILVY